MAAPSTTVNGRSRPLADVPPHTSALEWLRGLGLTGAKEGCAEGECGACSVLVARPGPDGCRWVALNACLLPAAALAGQDVVTAEGLGSPTDPHPVQRELAVRGGSQCGYCTPGFVCSMAAEYYRPERGADGFDLEAIGGNLCRCTGYRPIRDAALALGEVPGDDPLAARLLRPPAAPAPVRVEHPAGAYVRPTDLAGALAVLAEHPAATVVAGATDWGVEVNLHGARSSHVLAVDQVRELRRVELPTTPVGVIEIGAALSLSEVETALAGRVPLLDQVLAAFASRLVRNAATIGGNLATASPIGDLAPALLALDASVVLVSAAGERVVAVERLFTGYRRTALAPGELIRAVRIPTPLASRAAFHKVAKRRADDISSVAVAYALEVDGDTVTRARIGLGGVAETTIRARDTEAALEGSPWTEATARAAAAVLAGEGTPMDDHRASAAYRSAMLGQSLLKLWAESP